MSCDLEYKPHSSAFSSASSRSLHFSLQPNQKSQYPTWTASIIDAVSTLCSTITKAIFLCILVQIVTVNALTDWHRSSHSISIAKKCNPAVSKPCCCKYTSPCAIRYTVKGTWLSLIDTRSAPVTCSSQCENHYDQCRCLCNVGLVMNEVTSMRPCKCVVSKKALFKVKNCCYAMCKTARKKCIPGCQFKRCPVKASTVLNFNKVVQGKCKAICPHRPCFRFSS